MVRWRGFWVWLLLLRRLERLAWVLVWEDWDIFAMMSCCFKAMAEVSSGWILLNFPSPYDYAGQT